MRALNCHYTDDIISNYPPYRQPKLIWTDLRTRIIKNENCKILKRRLNQIDSSFPDFRFIDYSTPLLLACNNYNNIDYIEYLIKQKKANVNYSLVKWPRETMGHCYDPEYPFEFLNGFTPLMAIIMSKNKSKEQIVKMLVEYGANVNSKNEFGCTPLMLALCYGNCNIVKFLIENGADVNTVNKYGHSPLEISFESELVECNEQNFKTLIKHGACIQKFLDRWNLSKILNLDVESLKTKKHEMFYYARMYNIHKIDFACSLFEKGIGDPLREYMLNEIKQSQNLN